MGDRKKGREQALAGVRVLRHVVAANGAIGAAERAALRGFRELDLDDAKLDLVLNEGIELEDAVRAVTSKKVRKAVLKAARAIAHEHGSTREEEAVIAQMREAWGIEKGGDPGPHKNRPTDISELSRRFLFGEASTGEVAQKIKESLGED